ncbi:MAG: DNA-binding response OmpR family regulator [Flavobacteriales bacterium]
MKIALLEDDLQQAELVMNWLETAGHIVTHHSTGETFLRACRQEPFDVAILDWELPDQTGLEVLVTMRKHDKHTIPVIFATQRDDECDVIAALNAGADDYLIKPLRRGELMARLEVIRRRVGIESASEILVLGSIEINTVNNVISVDGKAVKVTQKDFDLAVIMLSNIGKVLSREYLLRTVWGIGVDLNTRTVDVHVSRVRRSLGIHPEMGYCITTIYQHGYRLEKISTKSDVGQVQL